MIPTSNSYPLQCQQKQETRNKKQENKTKQTKKKIDYGYIPAEFKLMDAKEIVVAFPANATFPLALVFGSTSKVLSDGSLGIEITRG